MSTNSPNQSVKLTKSVVDKLPVPTTGQAFYRDAELRGFGVRITPSGRKSFILEKRIDGRVRRQTIGRYGELTCEQARREAIRLLGQIATGINPIRERERHRLETVTLKDAWDAFKRTRGPNLKERTLYDYGRIMLKPLGDWQNRPLVKITRQKVLERHRQIGEQHGERYANLTMRFLSSLFNFAMANYQDGFGEPLITHNPVAVLGQTRSWYRTERRRSVIRVHELPAWHRAVRRLRAERSTIAESVADWLLLMVFTGLRRNEAARLTWDRVDLDDRTLFIPDPKNREPHALPLSDFLFDLLSARHDVARNAYVFPGEGPCGYVIEPKQQIRRVVELSGVAFTPHDLRRTFATVANAIELTPYTVKRLLNHKVSGDITASYIIADVERLREPMQRVTDYLVRAMEIKPGAQILAFSQGAHS